MPCHDRGSADEISSPKCQKEGVGVENTTIANVFGEDMEELQDSVECNRIS